MDELDINTAYTLIRDKLILWIESLIAMLPNLALAILILVVFYFVAKAARNLVGKMLSRVSNNKSLNNLIENIIYIIVIIVGCFIALDVLELEKTVTSLLAGVGVIGLALGFAFQDTAANFVSGIFLAVRSPIDSGDIVQVGDIMGVVQKNQFKSHRNSYFPRYLGRNSQQRCISKPHLQLYPHR